MLFHRRFFHFPFFLPHQNPKSNTEHLKNTTASQAPVLHMACAMCVLDDLMGDVQRFFWWGTPQFWDGFLNGENFMISFFPFWVPTCCRFTCCLRWFFGWRKTPWFSLILYLFISPFGSQLVLILIRWLVYYIIDFPCGNCSFSVMVMVRNCLLCNIFRSICTRCLSTMCTEQRSSKWFLTREHLL